MFEQLQKLLKTKGFWTTMKILYDAEFDIPGLTQMDFSKKLFFDYMKLYDGYYNMFYRIEPLLLSFGLIRSGRTSIGLTEKGRKVMDYLREVEKEVLR